MKYSALQVAALELHAETCARTRAHTPTCVFVFVSLHLHFHFMVGGVVAVRKGGREAEGMGEGRLEGGGWGGGGQVENCNMYLSFSVCGCQATGAQPAIFTLNKK